MPCPPMEPSLTEALADPIVRAIMRADRIDPAALESDLRRMARIIGGTVESERQNLDT